MKFNGTQGKWEIYGISDYLIEIYSVPMCSISPLIVIFKILIV